MSISDFAIRRRILLVLHRIRKVAAEKNSPRWIIFTSDVTISLVAIVFSYLIRFSFNTASIDRTSFLRALFIILSLRIFFFLIFKIYAHVIRYTSIYDLKRVFFTVLSGSLVILTASLTKRIIDGRSLVPLSIIVMEFFLTVYLMVNFRLVIRYIYILLNNIDLDSHATIIIGSKDLAVIMKDALEIQPKGNYKPIAFVDSMVSSKKKKLAGLNIYRLEELQFLIEKYSISRLIIAKEDISRKDKELIGILSAKYKIKMLTAPDLWNIPATGNLDIKEINMDELLERKPIKLKKEHIKEQLKDKTILITGAAGSIGSELVRQIASYKPAKLILIDQAETPLYDIELELKEAIGSKNYSIVLADILNKKRIEKVFDTFRPQFVYHAAAYKHVPMMENNPLEAFQNNVIGSRILADLSHKYGVEKFVMVSTDKAVNPTGIMGATKRMAEIYIQSLNELSNTNFITTRFGNVLNSNGSVIPRFLKQIKDGGPVTVTHPEITRFFMTIPEACQLVLEASVMGNGGEIFLFDMGKAVKILELAKNLIRSTGYLVGKDIEIVFTGLRPGEKLYEELLLDAEENKPTHHPKIKIAEVCKYDYDGIKNHIDKFSFPVETQSITEVVKLMKEMIPTYRSKNSVFEKLDKKAV
jgi:FlaA1/EpsC-like NDP-sugar epimerase